MTGANTQRIENLWSRLREFLPKHGLRQNKLQSYLYEFVYKHNHRGQFKQFLAEIVTVYHEDIFDEDQDQDQEQDEENWICTDDAGVDSDYDEEVNDTNSDDDNDDYMFE